MEIFKTIVIVLEVLASVAMILVVLFQSGKEAGLSGALGGKADTYLSKTNGGNLDFIRYSYCDTADKGVAYRYCFRFCFVPLLSKRRHKKLWQKRCEHSTDYCIFGLYRVYDSRLRAFD